MVKRLAHTPVQISGKHIRELVRRTPDCCVCGKRIVLDEYQLGEEDEAGLRHIANREVIYVRSGGRKMYYHRKCFNRLAQLDLSRWMKGHK